ncbi:PREDICTED: uncharacterized protein LOC108565918 [Nicrophorus vespilloides]|uniref:Uncharacterized protein LOC108565918 n=1 Tax=Nicrophorus vespilloides TaxID=110193 RepID=A0ABM1N2M9_NICVS|nr:PREDICTED: uncharacterized protein LOC108565918 [Nicrophorus vespilloides]
MHILILFLYLVNLTFARSVNSTGTEVVLATTTQNPVGTTPSIPESPPLSRYEKGLEDYDEAVENMRKARGMMMDDELDYDHDHDFAHDHDHHHDHEHQPPMMKEMVEQKAVKSDPWAGYYDFIINEGSFKFWAAFQLGTALLLIYSAFAAIYYAKFNPITTDYDYYDDFIFRGKRSLRPSPSTNWFGLDASTFQRILNAITTNKYS